MRILQLFSHKFLRGCQKIIIKVFLLKRKNTYIQNNNNFTKTTIILFVNIIFFSNINHKTFLSFIIIRFFSIKSISLILCSKRYFFLFYKTNCQFIIFVHLKKAKILENLLFILKNMHYWTRFPNITIYL